MDNPVAFALKVLICAVAFAMFVLSLVLFGELSSECFLCGKIKQAQKLANSFFWMALAVTVVVILWLIYALRVRAKNAKLDGKSSAFMVPLGYLILLIPVTVMAGVVMMNIKKSLQLLSCDDDAADPSLGEGGRALFKKARGVCTAAMMLSLVVLLATFLSLARELVSIATILRHKDVDDLDNLRKVLNEDTDNLPAGLLEFIGNVENGDVEDGEVFGMQNGNLMYVKYKDSDLMYVKSQDADSENE
jgi:hypothetical protein